MGNVTIMSTSPRDLHVLHDDAVAAIRAKLADPAATSATRRIAELFVAAREFFYTADGSPDWRGRSHAYRQFVGEAMSDAEVPREDLATLQAAVRYHVGAVLRETLDEETQRDLGLLKASPRQKSAERRGRYSEVLHLFNGAGAVDVAGLEAAAELMTRVVRRAKVAEWTPEERARAVDALSALVEEVRQVTK